MAKRFINEYTKICSKCLEPKSISMFYYRSDKKHLLQSRCKLCTSSDNNKSGRKYKDRLSKKQSEYHIKNREKRILYSRLYAQSNKHIRCEKDKERRKKDVNFRMSHNIRNRIRMALKRNSKSYNTNTLIGCSIKELKVHLQSLFKDDMSWDNYGEWQIDHKIPCAAFDLSNVDNQLICFNYKNLQPLWAIDNLIKKDKIEKEVYHR